MAIVLKVPKLGVAMTEGLLVEWLVDEGAVVVVGQPLYRLETDKVENEIEAPAGGVLLRIGVAGETYLVGSTIGEIQ